MGAHPVGSTLLKMERGAKEFFGLPAKRYKPHSLICRQGEADDRVFIVKSGWGMLYRGLPNGERQIIDTPLRGDIVGFHSGEGPRFASFACVTEFSVFEVPRKHLIEAMMLDGNLGIKFVSSLARSNAIISEHLMNAGRRNALTKTAHFLLELEERLSGVGLAALGRYECPLTQHDLADILGMTTVHVNRTLGELRKSDLIFFKSGHVDVIDRKKLVKMAGFDKEYLR